MSHRHRFSGRFLGPKECVPIAPLGPTWIFTLLFGSEGPTNSPYAKEQDLWAPPSMTDHRPTQGPLPQRVLTQVTYAGIKLKRAKRECETIAADLGPFSSPEETAIRCLLSGRKWVFRGKPRMEVAWRRAKESKWFPSFKAFSKKCSPNHEGLES